MRLVVIGCAGSFPGPASPASSYAVQAEDAAGRTWTVVLDLGSGAFGALQSVVDPFEIDAVALSHLHPDHFIDLCGMYVYRRYHPVRGVVRTGHPNPLAVWGPTATERRLGEAYGVEGGIEGGEDMRSAFGFRTWDPGRAATVGPFGLDVCRVRHPVEAYAIRVTGPSSVEPGKQVSITYTGDTDSCDAAVDLARDTDLLLAESAFEDDRDTVRGIHLTGSRAGELAAASAARRTLLTHLPVWNDPERVREAAAGAYDGPLEVVAPGATYAV
jgi:ribonuclease BN (tRNA processing enzyme)